MTSPFLCGDTFEHPQTTHTISEGPSNVNTWMQACVFVNNAWLRSYLGFALVALAFISWFRPSGFRPCLVVHINTLHIFYVNCPGTLVISVWNVTLDPDRPPEMPHREGRMRIRHTSSPSLSQLTSKIAFLHTSSLSQRTHLRAQWWFDGCRAKQQ